MKKILAILALLAVPQAALALDATAPVTATDGTIACPTCTTSADSLSDKGVVIGTGGSQGTKTVAVNSTATTKFLAQESDQNSGEPQFITLAAGDLPEETSAEVATRVTGETGTGALCFATSPSLDSPTITTSVALPSSAVDNIGEIADALKSGGTNGTLVGTTTGTLTSGNLAKFDANGNIVDAGFASVTAVNAVIAFSTETALSTGSSTSYLGLDGRVASSEDAAQVPVSAGTFGELRCVPTATPGGTGLRVTLGIGDCDGSLDFSNSSSPVQVTATTANTAVADTSDAQAATAGQCVALKVERLTTTQAAYLNCSIAKTSN